MALPAASGAGILRAAQKDLYFTNYLSSSGSEVLRLWGNSKWHRFSRHVPLASHLLYHSITTLRDLQTLGEEYTGLLQVDDSYMRLPSKSFQLLYILLGAFGEKLLQKILRRFKENVSENNELLPKPKKIFLHLIALTHWSLPVLQELHQALFFVGGQHYHIAKRTTGINYVNAVPGRRPRVGALRSLGLPYFLRALLTGIKSMPKFEYEDEPNEGVSHKESVQNFAACPGCLEDNSTPSALPCGHIFCNLCSRSFKSCAVCRAPYLTHRVVPLQNYTLKTIQ